MNKFWLIQLTFLCIAAFAQEKGSFKDRRDGKTYKTVKIGDQVWMAENLNYDAENSRCYGEIQANCAKYGRLYTWNSAKNACHKGWHLPTNKEWEILETTVGGSKTAGKHLKSKSGWTNRDNEVYGNGLDTYGFAALPGGSGNSRLGYYGSWWSASEKDDGYDDSYAYEWYIYYHFASARIKYNSKGLFQSVRCLED